MNSSAFSIGWHEANKQERVRKCNGLFTPSTRQDKTVLSHPCLRCEQAIRPSKALCSRTICETPASRADRVRETSKTKHGRNLSRPSQLEGYMAEAFCVDVQGGQKVRTRVRLSTSRFGTLLIYAVINGVVVWNL